MFTFNCPKNIANFTPDNEEGVFENCLVVVRDSPTGIVQFDIFYSLAAYTEGGHPPISPTKEVPYSLTNPVFLELIQTYGDDIQAIAYAYLKTLPEFAGAIDV